MKRYASILLALAIVLGLFAVPAMAEDGVIKIGILAPAVTHGWVAAVAYNAEARCRELQDERQGLEYKLSTSNNADEMTAQLDDLMIWGADAIVVFPQWQGMEVPFQKAVDAGIVVANFDLMIDIEGTYRVAGDNEDMGVQGAKYIGEKLGGAGKVVILDVPSSGSVAELRKKGFLDNIGAYPDIEIIGTYATEFTREAGLKDMADILTANPVIDAVYSMDDETSIGALQAIKEAGRTDVKVITGGGGCQEYFNMMLEDEYKDIWVQSALYSPAMVKDAVDVAIQVLTTEDDVPAVKIIPTTLVDKDNVDGYLDENTPY